MPSVSEKQLAFMKLVYGYKLGKISSSEVDDNIKNTAEKMSIEQLKDFIEESINLKNLITLLENKVNKKIILEATDPYDSLDSLQLKKMDQIAAKSTPDLQRWVLEQPEFFFKDIKTNEYVVSFMGFEKRDNDKVGVVIKFKKDFSETGAQKEKFIRYKNARVFFAQYRFQASNGEWMIYLDAATGSKKKQRKNKEYNLLLKAYLQEILGNLSYSSGSSTTETADIRKAAKTTIQVLNYLRNSKNVKRKIREDTYLRLITFIKQHQRAGIFYTPKFLQDFERAWQSAHLPDYETVVKEMKSGIVDDDQLDNLTIRNFTDDMRKSSPIYNLDLTSLYRNKMPLAKIQKIVDSVNLLRKSFKEEVIFRTLKPGEAHQTYNNVYFQKKLADLLGSGNTNQATKKSIMDNINFILLNILDRNIAFKPLGWTQGSNQQKSQHKKTILDTYITFLDKSKIMYESDIDIKSLKILTKEYSDFEFSVEGNVNISKAGLTKIPLNFVYIRDNFDCSNNQLISLENCPKIIRGNFDCSNNKLASLKEFPKEVEGSLICYSNNVQFKEEEIKKICKVGNKIITKEG